MIHRRLTLCAFILVPAVGAAAACGSSGNQNNPDAGTMTTDSGVPDVSVEDTGAPMDSGTSKDSTATSDGSCAPAPTGPFTEATHGPLPTMAYFGGGIMTAPEVISFTFSNMPHAAEIQAFGQNITHTDWFAAVSKDYCVPDGGPCVQPGPLGISVPMPMAADATYVDDPGGSTSGGTDLEAFIGQQIAAAVAAKTISEPTPNSLYVFYFPPTTTIWLGPVNQGTPTCQGVGGYHSALAYGDAGTPIAYAVVPYCDYPNAPDEVDYQQFTLAASHEVIEAVTDPMNNVDGQPAWILDTPMAPDAAVTTNEFRNDPWLDLQFQEVGDNCESLLLDFWNLDDAGTIVQRIWSTSAASAGHNPCIPVPAGESYYNVSTDKAIYVANVGDTFTVDLSAFSDVARPSWLVQAIDATPTQTPSAGNPNAPLPYLNLEFVGGTPADDAGDPTTLTCVNNGSKAQLKVTLLADPDNDTSLQYQQEWPEADGIINSFDLADPQTYPGPDGGPMVAYPYQFWPFAVVTPATAAAVGIPAAGVTDVHQLRTLRKAHHRQLRRGPSAIPSWHARVPVKR
jgi:hypothetical protein